MKKWSQQAILKNEMHIEFEIKINKNTNQYAQ